MNKKTEFVVIENDILTTYRLDDKDSWTLGRKSKQNPDIECTSPTISRQHGTFIKKDGVWVYVDAYGVNGTIYNKEYLTNKADGYIGPIIVEDKDIFLFGCGKNPVINDKMAWGMFLENAYDGGWRTMNTEGCSNILITNGYDQKLLNEPSKGCVVEFVDGIAIYMGNKTFVSGNIALSTKVK